MKIFNIFTCIVAAILLIFGFVTFLNPSLWTEEMMKGWLSVLIIIAASYMFNSVIVKKLAEKEEEKDKKQQRH